MGLRGPIAKPADQISYSMQRKRAKAAKLSPPSEPLTELPDPPDFLNEKACEVWAELGGVLIGQGTLCVGDLGGLAALCSLTGQRQALEADLDANGFTTFDGKVDRMRPEYTIYRDSFKPWFELLKVFGLTPMTRNRVPKAAPLTLHMGEKALKYFNKLK